MTWMSVLVPCAFPQIYDLDFSDDIVLLAMTKSLVGTTSQDSSGRSYAVRDADKRPKTLQLNHTLGTMDILDLQMVLV